MSLYLNPQAQIFIPSTEYTNSVNENNKNNNEISFDHFNTTFDWMIDEKYWNDIDIMLIQKHEMKKKYNNVMIELNDYIRKKNINILYNKINFTFMNIKKEYNIM